MSGITFAFIILMFVYIFYDNKVIEQYIQEILRIKLNISLNHKQKSSIKTFNNNDSKKNNQSKINSKEKVEKNPKIGKKNQTKSNKKKHNDKNKNKNFPPKRESSRSTNINNSYKRSIDNLISYREKVKSKSNLLRMGNKHFSKIRTNEKKKTNNIIHKHKTLNKKKSNNKIDRINTLNKKKKGSSNDSYIIKNTQMYLDKLKIKDLNDEELNSLEYEIATVIDKRSYFKYYCSLLKKKHLIIFAFYPVNDYNLMAIKISLLLLSFSLYFTINGFFFSDETMNKISEDKGAYDILYQIPQILYSTVISALINMILKKVSLSEKNILTIKLESDYLIAQKKAKNIRSCVKIKLAIFFIISFIFMAFFWYFISCFCAVYKNTQIILIKDTLISFALSMLYPFGLNLLPGLFRIPALRAAKKDKKCLYKASGLIALI